MSDHKDNIIKEFKFLVKKTKLDQSKGSAFKLKNYQRVIVILSKVEKIESTVMALEYLRQGGMGLKKETPPNWSSKILKNIDKIITEGSLGLERDPKLEVVELLGKIPEVGPSKANALYEQGIRSLEDLQQKPDLLNRKQLIGLRYMSDLGKKIPRDEMTIWGNSLKHLVRGIVGDSNEIKHMDLVGSYRRGKLESGDIDFYLALEKPEKGLMTKIYDKLVDEGYMKPDDWFSKGSKKLMGVAKLGLENQARHLDIFIYPVEEYPFALLYATGSGEFNVKMRNYARTRGYSLSDRGLLVGNNKGELVSKEKYQEVIGKPVVECERDIFEFLGLTYLDPPDRLPEFEFPKNES